ncbi:pyruvate dehydrogenase E2 component (dihydrolipoamide acetyltransferase) [Friedmanniella endophytica]|uniref:Dihydrolipoamide acetyltransferase component of pyruvate dehydrogenase complex n=1 Tax=Microlunatus kandeliicorticis TaxID=1759536 RepID=A0A7W3IQQ0_9ACTN|nr:dihydrolipoamide acetyltransferase family protein [Microlunatus kandeliicorticis]MBA8793496.1 pyruvate dehydrogenase E2 component (dihydrolipoamide acetyltransferase) [Microlunatus kandeliicorticis]
MKEFRLPDPGEGLVEADIVTWRVAEGDEVKINDIVVEVETSKSLVELPIPFAGRVARLLVAEGDTVDVGTPIIAIDDGSGTPAPVDGPAAADAPTDDLVPALADPEASGTRVANLVGYGPREGGTRRRPRRPGADPAVDPAETASRAGVADSFATDHPVGHRPDEVHPLTPTADEPHGAPLPAPGPATPPTAGVDVTPVVEAGRPLAKPPVRKLAKDLGVDLTTVTGTGDGGIVTRDDVRAAVSGTSAPQADLAEPAAAEDEPESAGPARPARLAGEDRRVPIKGVRKATALAMTQSAFTAPHVSVWLTCDVTATMELVAKLKQRKEFADLRVSPLLIISKAVCLALGRTPELNSSWDEANQEIVFHGGVNLGIAAATPRGLVVPNIKGAERLSLVELAAATGELVSTARAGRTQPAQMAGGTFSITNIGPLGVDAGTPILNPGEAGILAVGTIDRRPWVVGTGADERVAPRWVATLALSFDHRLADGEQGSRFLVDVADILRDPGLALLH